MDKTPHKVWTYDDLLAMDERRDGKKYEILDGVLYVSPSPTYLHQVVLKRLFVELYEQLEKRGLAEVLFAPLDVILSKTRVVQPDLLVVSIERKAILEWHGVTAAPDLAVEILSPSNTHHDRVRKRRFYARTGVREYWIVDPVAEDIEVLALIEGGLSYRQAGWYAAGDRAKSTLFELDVEVDPIFRKDDELDPMPIT
jgi:Uma2 family endonuclease